MADVKLPFGLRDGVLVHVSSVERGLKCLCHCPGCNAPLVARKGNVAAYHFAHKAETPCLYQPETALHQYAKQAISRQQVFSLPSLPVIVQNRGYGIRFQEEIGGTTISIRRAVQEQQYQDIVPDVQIESDSGLIFVEVAVTHFVDHEKRTKLAGVGIPTIEINLSSIPLDASIESIDQAILGDAFRRKWVFHPREAFLRRQLEQRLGAALNSMEHEVYGPDNEATDFDAEEIGEDEDGEGWRLLAKAEDYADDASLTDMVLRDAPTAKRVGLYKSMSHVEKLAYHCFLLGVKPRRLPSFFNRFDGGIPHFSCPSVVWRTGVFVRFVHHYRKPFALGDVVDWCRGRYELFSYGDVEKDELSNWSLSSTESEVFDFLADLEFQGYLESDGFIAKRRQFVPTGMRIAGR